MSLRRVDGRFLLPAPPSSAVVLGGLDAWSDGLRDAGVSVAALPSSPPPDLVVAPAGFAAAGLAVGAPMVLFEGWVSRRRLRAAGLIAQHFLAVSHLESPEALVPLGQPRVTRYAFEQWRAPRSAWHRRRNRAFARLAPVMPVSWPRRRILTIGSVGAGPPFPCAGLDPPPAGWLLVLGAPHGAGRAALMLFGEGDRLPDRVVKFPRLAAVNRSDTEVRALTMVASFGPPASCHAVTLVGRHRAGGLDCLVETAAAGAPLSGVLGGPGSRKQRLEPVSRVAGWLVEVARSTSQAPSRLDAERIAMALDIRDYWSGLGVPLDLVDRVPQVPAVMVHGDLWSDNVVVRGGEFMVLDWESAKPAGFPFSDLAYFLADSLSRIDGEAGDDEAVDRHFVRLFRGEAPSSRYLFSWMARMQEALGLPQEAVGPLVSVGWTSLVRAAVEPEAIVATYATEAVQPAERFTSLWFADPSLGAGWSGWRAAMPR